MLEGIKSVINGSPREAGSDFRIMTEKHRKTAESLDMGAESPDHKSETAISIFGELSDLLVASDRHGYSVLSYLLRMALLEAQSLASEHGDVVNLHPANSESHH